MATGFLTRSINRVRRYTDEPSTNAKWTDSDIIDEIESSWADTLSEINRLTTAPIVVRHDLNFQPSQNMYVLPPTVGRILQLAKINSTTGVIEWRLRPRSRFNPSGPGIIIEGNVIRVEPNWTEGNETLRLVYMLSGDLRLHSGTAETITNDSTNHNCAVVLAETVTVGERDVRANAYAGCILRVLTATTNDYGQERIITSYDHTTRTATLEPEYADVPGGTVTYEVVPMVIGKSFDKVCSLDVAATILGIEGDQARAASVEKQFARKMRQIRLDQSAIESIVGSHFQSDTDDNLRYLGW